LVLISKWRRMDCYKHFFTIFWKFKWRIGYGKYSSLSKINCQWRKWRALANTLGSSKNIKCRRTAEESRTTLPPPMPDTEYCCKQLCYFKTTLHTKQSNEVKVCIHTSKRGVSLCFSIYVCILWGVPMTEKFTSWRMKPEVYIQLILNNSGITTIFRINSMYM
jgi:hypothetical protein